MTQLNKFCTVLDKYIKAKSTKIHKKDTYNMSNKYIRTYRNKCDLDLFFQPALFSELTKKTFRSA
jgi:hypothetical protein